MPIIVTTCIPPNCHPRVGVSSFRIPADPKRKELWKKALQLDLEFLTVKDPRTFQTLTGGPVHGLINITTLFKKFIKSGREKIHS